jgi:hypothetical protein
MMHPSFAVICRLPSIGATLDRSRHPPFGSMMHPSSPQTADREPQSRPNSDKACPPSHHEAARAAGLKNGKTRKHRTRAGTNGRDVGLDMTVLLTPRDVWRYATHFDEKTGLFR